MSTQASNPFVFPGLGQAQGNPLLASMEMMRQAWQDMTSAGMFAQPMGASALTTEQLDKRIADMRAVEGWLKLNLSMLTSSIQALEVQRATLGTLKSYMGFAAGAAEAAGASAAPSPLDVALGIKPSGQARIKSAGTDETSSKTVDKAQPGGADSAMAEPFSEAAQAWWSLLQQQFNTLTATTAASMQAADTAKPKTPEKNTSARASAAAKTASASRKKNSSSRASAAGKSSKSAKPRPA